MFVRHHSFSSHTSPVISDAAASAKQSKDDLDVVTRKDMLNRKLTELSQTEKSLQQQLHRHWRFDRTVNQDLSDKKTYSEQRKNELKAIKGGEDIAAQYGLTLAVTDAFLKDHLQLLKVDTPIPADYMRDQVSTDYYERCREIYKAKGGNTSLPVLFVNSENGAEQVLGHFRGTKHIYGTPEQHLSKNLEFLQPGLYALPLRYQSAVIPAQKLIHIYGAQPSAYALMAGANGPKQTVIPDVSVDNQKLLNALRPLENGVCDRLRDIPDKVGPAKLAKAAADMVEQLADVYEDRDTMAEHRHNPVLANGLKAMRAIADSLPELSHDSYKFSSAYQTLCEELQVCLSATKPYDLSDFKMAAAPLLAAEHLPSSVPEPQMHLVSSGMGALALGLDAAEIMTGNQNVTELSSLKHGKSPVYYEVNKLRQERSTESAHDNTLYATLNHSIPNHPENPGWNVDAVIESLQAHLNQTGKRTKPVVLIVDATLEKRGDMDKLVSRFANDIAQNRLKMVVCKSYQKFANLGSAKVMAGGIGIISADDPATRQAQSYLNHAEESLNLMANNDAQLMVHLLGCREHEFQLLDRAVENGRFVAQNLFHGEDGHQPLDFYDDHLPFGMLSMQSEPHLFSLDMADGHKDLKLNRESHVVTNYLKNRDSFGFTTTTLSGVPVDRERTVRMSYGQESQAELTERLYMPSLLMKKGEMQWDCSQARKLIHELANDAIKTVRIPPHVRPTLRQKLYVAGQLEKPEPDNTSRLTSGTDALRQQQLKNGARGMTLNKVASVMDHLSEVILMGTKPEQWIAGKDRPVIDELLAGVIYSGMPGVSSAGRSAVLALQKHMSMADMLSSRPEQQQQGLNALAGAMIRLPGWPQMANTLVDIPDNVFESARISEQSRVIQAMFAPLDSQTRLHVIQQCVEQDQLSKAEALLKFVEEGDDSLAPDSFYSATHDVDDGLQNLPRPMNEREQNLQLNRLRLQEQALMSRK